LLVEQLGIGCEYDVNTICTVTCAVDQMLPLVDEVGHFAGLTALRRQVNKAQNLTHFKWFWFGSVLILSQIEMLSVKMQKVINFIC
jgi:hypothetical protein